MVPGSHLPPNRFRCFWVCLIDDPPAVSDSRGKPRDIRALSSIKMELLQRYVKKIGAIGVDNLHRWPSNSDAPGFLSATISAASAAELLKVC